MAELERTDKPVKILVNEFKDGILGVPEIQRSYVWSPSQARDLVDSIYRKYPSGLVLLWKPKNLPKYSRSSNGSRNPDYLILDGQQRITALQKVIHGEINLYFHILDGALQIINRKDGNSSPLLVPVVSILKDAFKVLTNATETIKLTDTQKEQVHKNLKDLCKIEDYLFPVMIMHTDDYEEITESFIRLNSKGTRLDSIELAIARVAFQWPGAIVNQFETALKEYAEADYELDITVLVRFFLIIGKVKNRVPEKTSALFSLDNQHFMDTWKKAKKAFNGAINFLKNNAGIESSKWLTSQYIIIPLAFFLYKKDREKITESEVGGLMLWFFITIVYARLTGRMSNLDKDIRALDSEYPISNLIKNLREDIPSFSVAPEMITGSYNRSNLKPLLMIILSYRGAKDFFTGASIKSGNIGYENQVQSHHIFPKSLLKKMGISVKLYDDIANIAFISQRANIQISNTEPIEYLKNIDAERLESQFIPMYRELWKLSRFKDFCEERRKLMAKAINDFLDEQLQKSFKEV